jgi:hypothetical protein
LLSFFLHVITINSQLYAEQFGKTLRNCLAKVLENVNPEIDRNGYHRYNNDQDNEQWRYLCFSTPDNIKNNSICDSNDDGSDDKRSHKEVDHGFTPCISALMADSTTVGNI